MGIDSFLHFDHNGQNVGVGTKLAFGGCVDFTALHRGPLLPSNQHLIQPNFDTRYISS